MFEEARMLWQQNKEDFVPTVAKLFGFIFDKLSSHIGVPEKMGGVVDAAFTKLAEAQKGLVNGGIQVPLLPYDEPPVPM
jgi:hypothetical protein